MSESEKEKDNLLNVNVEDLAGLSKPATKLIEVLENCGKGLGKIFIPMYNKEKAKSDAKSIEIISSEINKNLHLPIKYTGDNFSIDMSTEHNLLDQAQKRVIFQELEKQKNINSIVNVAMNELEDVEQISDEPVEKDWILRFIDDCANISNEDIQRLWGKILANEVKFPKSFSLKSLGVLKDLSSDEANLFEEICKDLVTINDENFILNEETSFHGNNKEYYSKILKLQDCELINASFGIEKDFKIKNKEEFVLLYNNTKYCFNNKTNHDKSITIQVFPLTKAGNDIIKVVNKHRFDKMLVESFCIKLKNLMEGYGDLKNYDVMGVDIKFVVSAYKIISNIDGEIECEDEDLLEDLRRNYKNKEKK